jgi:glucokinase
MECAIGIDLGSTYLKHALIGLDGEIFLEAKIPTEAHRGRKNIIDKMIQCIHDLKTWAEMRDIGIVGVGIGTPGIIDSGLILGGAENLPEWESLPLAGILSRQFDFPVFIDNDANLMALGEVRYGKDKEKCEVVYILVGTGIGGALVLNGKLFGGHRNRGTELGHFVVDPRGESCSCGAKGCLEAQASATALIRDYKRLVHRKMKGVVKEPDVDYIVSKYLENEKEAMEAFEIHFNYLSAGIAGYINIFSPQRVIIGGELPESGNFYIDQIRTRSLRIAMNQTKIFTRICAAELGDKAGCFGAAALVFDHVGLSAETDVAIPAGRNF